MPPGLRDREGGGTTYSGATLRTLWTTGHLGGRSPAIVLVGVLFVARRDLEQCQQEVFTGRRMALVQRFVVPATFGIAAGGHAGLPQHMRPGLACATVNAYSTAMTLSSSN